MKQVKQTIHNDALNDAESTEKPAKLSRNTYKNNAKLIPKCKETESTETASDLVPVYQNAIPYDPPPAIRIRLSTPKTLRKSMANIMRMAAKGEISMERARSLAYLAQTLAGLFSLESSLSLEGEIKQLRRLVEKLEREGTL